MGWLVLGRYTFDLDYSITYIFYVVGMLANIVRVRTLLGKESVMDENELNEYFDAIEDVQLLEQGGGE